VNRIFIDYRPKVNKGLLIFCNLQVQKHQILIALDEAFFTVVKTPPNKPAQKTNSSDTHIPNIPGPAVAPRAPKFTISREWSGNDRTLAPETLPCLPLQTMPFNEGSTSGTIAWTENVGTKQLGLKDCQLDEDMLIAYGSISSIDS
jgi:hypothetical protein